MATLEDEITETTPENKSKTILVSKPKVHKWGDATQSLIEIQGGS
jgi:hypothetical protein